MAGTEDQVRLNSSQMNDNTKARQLIHEEHNSGANHRYILDAIEQGRARDINDEVRVDNDPCLIIGSGPSLDEAIDAMKRIGWTGGLICTTSHANTFMYHGIEPTHIMALDPFCTWEEIDSVDWSQTGTKLITHPGVEPTLLRNWPNDVLLYRQNNGRANSYYANEQKRMYTRREYIEGKSIRDATFHYLIRTEITLFACSPPAQMFAADKLGYGTIFLAGCDFNYHSGKARFTGWSQVDGVWTESVSPWPTETTEKERQEGKLVTLNNGTETHEIHLYYKKNMLSAIRLSGQNVVTTDLRGSLADTLPTAEIRDVLGKHGRGWKQRPKNWERMKHKLDEYLAAVGAYCIEAGDKKSFVETANPDIDLYLHMLDLRKGWQCGNCGSVMKANDNNDHTNKTPCPYCQASKMTRISEIDVRANMQRFWSLANYDKANRIAEQRPDTLLAHTVPESVIDAATEGA